MEFEFDVNTKEHAATILNAINGMRADGKNHDIIIKVGDEEIGAHKNVLMTGSKYFEAMFSHDTVERKSGAVEMKDVDFDSVKAYIDFIYTGKMSATSEKCELLLTAASIMQLPTVIEQISKFLHASLNQETCYRTKKIAEKFDLQDLSDACDKFAMENFTSIAQETDFLEMELEYICFLLESIKMETTADEDKKCEAIIKWIKADTSCRGEHIVNMVGLLNLDRVSVEYVQLLAEKEELCYGSAECMRMMLLSTAKKVKVTEKEPNALIMFNISRQKLQAYKPSTKQLKDIHCLSEDFIGKKKFVAVNVRGIIRTLHDDQSMYRLDTAEDGCEWRKSRSMLRPHGAWLSATVLNDDIFVTGQNSMEKYSICKDEWEMIDTPNITCLQNVIVSFQGCVYSIGGGIEGKTTNLVYKYFPKTEEWKPACSMLRRRSIPSAACCREKIFVSGGYSHVKLDETEFYDVASDTWTMVAPLTIPRQYFTLCVLGNKIFAVGCESDSLSIEQYDDTGSWKIIEENPDIKIVGKASCTGYFP